MMEQDKIFKQHQVEIYRRTDRMFAVLIIVQYLVGIVAALVISPRTWEGSTSAVHIHVYAAVVLGGLITLLPVSLALLFPGETRTRHVIAVAQMLQSALLIHLSGGRIETHFHVFGSLAFLGFYRDPKVLISASVVVALDHFLRGVYWPESVYGIAVPETWRWLEHTGWVIFEDFFIILATRQSLKEMREIARERADREKIAYDRAVDIERLKVTERSLSEALETRDTFLSICSHELKSPIATLRLSAQMVNRAIKSGEDLSQVSVFLDEVSSQSERVYRLVDDMLDVTHIRTGKLSINREHLELSALVQSVINRCTPVLSSVGCKVTFQADPVEGDWDRMRLEQVLLNLLVNAAKYAPAKPVEVSVTGRDNKAWVKIRDFGKGIPKSDQQRVFERFERGKDSRRAPGMGLGLFISKHIIEQHGGHISLESEEGKGALFTVELPTRAAG